MQPSTTISFRLSPEELQLLDEQCLEFKLSRGEFARVSLKRSLAQKSSAAEMNELIQEVKKLERLHAKGLLLLLQTLGQLKTDDAIQLIRSFLA